MGREHLRKVKKNSMVLFLRNHSNRACEVIYWRENDLAAWCNVSGGHSDLTKKGLQLKNQRHKRLMGDKDNSLNNCNI